MHVDLVVSRAIVCDPLHARRQLRDELLVEDADVVRGDVVTIDTDDAVILSPGLEAGEELGAVGGVHRLERISGWAKWV